MKKKILKFNPLNLFIGFTILASSLRSLVPLILNDSSFAYPSIQMSFFLGILLSCFSLIKLLNIKKSGKYSFIVFLMLFNLLLNILWHIPYIVTFDYNEIIMIIYTGFFPLSFLLMLRLNEKTLLKILAIILVVVSISILSESYELNTGNKDAGYENARARQLILRPDTKEYFGRTGNFLRTGGLLGIRPHDSGSLLAILGILFGGLAIRKRKILSVEVVLTLLSFIALMLSQSGSNIAAFFVGMIFLVIYYRTILWNYKLILFVFIVFCFFISFILTSNSATEQISQIFEKLFMRFSPEHGDWSGMLRIGFTNMYIDISSFLFGFCTLIGCNIASVTEIGFIGTLVEYGFLYFSLFMVLLSYPLLVFLKQVNPNKMAIPYVAAVLVGFISLWHYGTVLRTTNIFVYFSIYSMSLKILFSPVQKYSK